MRDLHRALERDESADALKVHTALCDAGRAAKCVQSAEDALERQMGRLRARIEDALEQGATVSQLATVAGVPKNMVEELADA